MALFAVLLIQDWNTRFFFVFIELVKDPELIITSVLSEEKS
jgi:hypothetical protein